MNSLTAVTASLVCMQTVWDVCKGLMLALSVCFNCFVTKSHTAMKKGVAPVRLGMLKQYKNDHSFVMMSMLLRAISRSESSLKLCPDLPCAALLTDGSSDTCRCLVKSDLECLGAQLKDSLADAD